MSTEAITAIVAVGLTALGMFATSIVFGVRWATRSAVDRAGVTSRLDTLAEKLDEVHELATTANSIAIQAKTELRDHEEQEMVERREDREERAARQRDLDAKLLTGDMRMSQHEAKLDELLARSQPKRRRWLT